MSGSRKNSDEVFHSTKALIVKLRRKESVDFNWLTFKNYVDQNIEIICSCFMVVYPSSVIVIVFAAGSNV